MSVSWELWIVVMIIYLLYWDSSFSSFPLKSGRLTVVKYCKNKTTSSMKRPLIIPGIAHDVHVACSVCLHTWVPFCAHKPAPAKWSSLTVSSYSV